MLPFFLHTDSLYLKMTAKDLWDDIVEEIGWYYLYEFKE